MKYKFFLCILILSTALDSYTYNSKSYTIKKGKFVRREEVQDYRYNRYACQDCPHITHKKLYYPTKCSKCHGKNFVSLPRDYPCRIYWDKEGRVERIARIDIEGNALYFHEYKYGEDGILFSEILPFELGSIDYKEGKTISPFHKEEWEIDDNLNIISHDIDGDRREYSYNEFEELEIPTEDIDYSYNKDGNLEYVGDTRFFYDKYHRLKRATTPKSIIEYKYDKKGQRVIRIVNGKRETFMLQNGNDHIIQGQEVIISGFSNDSKLVRAIAIETESAIYVPIYDRSHNIIKLINGETREIITLERPDPFGKGLSKTSPTSYIFASKYYDKELDIVYFGSRFYCPKIHKWLTPDPEKQSSDLYQYCFNNPFKYKDLDGRYAVSLTLLSVSWGEGVAVATCLSNPVGLAVTGIVAGAYLGYEGYKWYQDNKDRDWSFNYCTLEKRKKERLGHNDAPPYTWDDLGKNPNKCPGKGFEWRGKGKPESGKGNWVKGKSKEEREELHPDLEHPDHGPHWDYYGPRFPRGTRIYPDGWENKRP